MSEGFPLLTTKKVHWKSVAAELCWFLRGGTNIGFLLQYGVTIWNEWADSNGDLGPVYGKQWRAWTHPDGTIDQIRNLVEDLRRNPNSRRHIVSAWNPADVPKMKLPPCHTLWQCYVDGNQRLSLHLYARSIDAFLGLPFNIASYALLLKILARLADLSEGHLIISFGDLHIYKNHFEQVDTQLSRGPRRLPDVVIDSEIRTVTDLDSLRPEQFQLVGYDPHPAIKAPIAV